MIAEWFKEWAIVISGGATLSLAVAAFWAIWQNYQLRRKEYSRKILDDIIAWATDAINLDYQADFNSAISNGISYDLLERAQIKYLLNTQSSYLVLCAKTGYVEIMASSLKVEALEKAVALLIKRIDKHMSIIHEYLEEKPLNFEQAMDKLGDDSKKLNSAGFNVIEQACAIKKSLE